MQRITNLPRLGIAAQSVSISQMAYSEALAEAEVAKHYNFVKSVDVEVIANNKKA